MGRAGRRLLIVALGLALATACKRSRPDEPPPPPGHPGPDPRLVIAVDPRVELLSVVSRLAGYPEYGKPPSTSYARAVDRHFAAWADHPAVATARALRQRHGIAYNAPITLAVYLDQDLAPRRPLAPDLPGLDRRWRDVDLDGFAAQLRDFAAATGFTDFLAEHRDFFARVEAQVAAALDGYRVIDWFDGVLGPRPATFRVVPGLLTGDSAYGCYAVEPGGGEEIVQVLYLPPGELPRPDRATIYILIHEFGHSYVNPVLDARPDLILPAIEPLFERSREVMTRQNYPAARIVANESMVRALAVLYARERGAPGAEGRRLRYERDRGFAWIAESVAALDAARRASRGPLTADQLAGAARDGFEAYRTAHPR